MISDPAAAAKPKAKRPAAEAQGAKGTKDAPAAPTAPANPADPAASAAPGATAPGGPAPGPEATPAPEAAAAPEAEPPKKKKKKDGAAEGSELFDNGAEGGASIEVKGRVFVAAEYQRRTLGGMDIAGNMLADEASDMTLLVPSARAGIRVRILDPLTLVLEADFSEKPKMKDGFIQWKKKRWSVKAGQFKMPISSFTLESPWTLPLARRGLLEELISDHMLLTGRRQGVQGQWTGGGWLDPAVAVGIFRPVKWGPDAGDPVEGVDPAMQTVVVRASATPGDLEVGAVAQWRVTAVTLDGKYAPHRYGTFGLDGTSELEVAGLGLRLWAEALAGSSWLDHEMGDEQTVTYYTARALGAVRWGGREKGEHYVEPFLTVGMLDPNASVVEDMFVETMVGVNVGHWRQTRLTLQFEYGTQGRNFPAAYFTGFGLRPIVKHTAVVLQAGAAF